MATPPAHTTMTDEINISQGRIFRKRMWPTLETAVRVQDIANFLLIASLVVGVICTFLVVWMGNVKEEYLRLDISGANERAAIAIKEAAESKLEQERLRAKLAWRRLNVEQHEKLVSLLKPYAGLEVWIGTVKNDPESNLFWKEIVKALNEAGINVVAHTSYAMAMGISINHSNTTNAKTLKNAFAAAGIPLSDAQGDSERRRYLEIVIGTKPELF